MRDSSTYQAILTEGRAEGRVEGRIEQLREDILELATQRFGELDEALRAVLNSIPDRPRLKRIRDHINFVTGWGELLRVK